MCMHWLKYRDVRLNRKDRLKNMRGTRLEVAILADVSWTHNVISSTSIYQCMTGPLWHECSSCPLGVLHSDWSTKH